MSLGTWKIVYKIERDCGAIREIIVSNEQYVDRFVDTRRTYLIQLVGTIGRAPR